MEPAPVSRNENKDVNHRREISFVNSIQRRKQKDIVITTMRFIIFLGLLIQTITAEDSTTAPTSILPEQAPLTPVEEPTEEPIVEFDTPEPSLLETEAPTAVATSTPVPPPTEPPIPVPVAAPTPPPVTPTPPPVAPVQTTLAPVPAPIAPVIASIAPVPAPYAFEPVATSAPTSPPAPMTVGVTTARPFESPVDDSIPAPIARTLSPTSPSTPLTFQPTSSLNSGNMNPPTLEEDDELLSLPVWIGIGVAALVVMGAVVCIALRGGGGVGGDSNYSPSQRKPSQPRPKQDPHFSSQNQPEVEIQITNDDDISTIGYPTVATRSYRGDQQSLPTVDYDYTRSYGAGQDGSVVSSAAGTMGDTTTPSVTTAAINRLSEPRTSSQQLFRSSREMEIVAPPGKLGVVLDASDDHDDPVGCPVVHTVKDSSPLIGQLQVGDKIIALDDEDVRGMTALQVSKLISMKSANPRRKFTILRSS